MTRLHQLIATTPTVKATSEQTFTKLYQHLNLGRSFLGLNKTYQPKDEEGRALPPESVKVQNKAPDLVSQAVAALTRLIDHTATQDAANTLAQADIVVGGVTLASQVPVTTLLYLEKKLGDIKTFVEKLPVLDPMENWTWDSSAQVWRSEPYQTIRSGKIEEFVALPQQMPERHPTQHAKVTRDEEEGTWTAIKLSGAIPLSAKRGALARVDELTIAVKTARESANAQIVTDVTIAARLLDHIFSGLHE